jgi:hypothetical protein
MRLKGLFSLISRRPLIIKAIFVLITLASVASTWACGEVESQVLFRVEPSGNVTMIKGLTRGGNNCIDDHTWKGPKILLRGQLVDATNCATTRFLYCGDLTVSGTDDPTLSPKISLPYPIKRFPESFRISKDKFDEIKEVSDGKSCVDVQLPLNASNYESCLKQIKYREAPSPSPSEEEISDPDEIVFPGAIPASPSPRPSLTPKTSPSK